MAVSMSLACFLRHRARMATAIEQTSGDDGGVPATSVMLHLQPAMPILQPHRPPPAPPAILVVGAACSRGRHLPLYRLLTLLASSYLCLRPASSAWPTACLVGTSQRFMSGRTRD